MMKNEILKKVEVGSVVCLWVKLTQCASKINNNMPSDTEVGIPFCRDSPYLQRALLDQEDYVKGSTISF